LLDGIDSQPRSVDEIAQARGMSVAHCTAALTELELGGFVQRLADGYIRRPSEF
jgi:predicted Rossmann fold nucleotide-binding protein DprA/Smf involved in DNA uptake